MHSFDGYTAQRGIVTTTISTGFVSKTSYKSTSVEQHLAQEYLNKHT